MTTAPDWSELPCDIVGAISNRLGAIEDFLSISAVCRSWRSALPNNKNWRPSVPRLPWLMLPQSGGDYDGRPTVLTLPLINPIPASAVRSIFSLERNKLFNLDVPEIHDRHCFGSQIGWIFTCQLISRGNGCDVSDLDHEAHLVNPVTRFRIPLPPFSSLVWFEVNDFMHKAVTFHHHHCRRPPSSPSSDSDDIVVIAICGAYRNLALARPGYTTWVPVEIQDTYSSFEDVVCYGGDQILALRRDGSLALCKIDDTSAPPKAKAVAFAPALHCNHLQLKKEFQNRKVYLVESEGDLLLVVRLWRAPPTTQEDDDYSFTIFKLNFGNREWVELEQLGNRTLFLGDSYSMSYSAGHGPLRCQPNSIYCIDDFTRWRAFHFGARARDRARAGGRIVRDIGIFNIEGSTFEPRYLGGVDDARPHFHSPPIWVVPSF